MILHCVYACVCLSHCQSRPAHSPHSLPEVSMSALIAIHRQQMTRHIKAVAHTHRRADVMAGYIARWQAGESVGAIAASEHYSPYLLARQFVEALCGVDRKAVGKHMKATGLIEDARLRAEVGPLLLSTCVVWLSDCAFVDVSA